MMMNSGASTATSPTTVNANNEQQHHVHNAKDDWAEFCDRHARVAAADFAKVFFVYLTVELSETARAALSYRDFLRRFVEIFCEHFETEYLRHTAAK